MVENPAGPSRSTPENSPVASEVRAATAATSGTAPEPTFFQRVREDLFRPKQPQARDKRREPHRGDSLREVVETIVFVVVLVLMLKAFVAEAFVIPTGSMATSLLGYHRHARCGKCGCQFPVNASSDAEEFRWWQTGPASYAVCPNCRNIQELGSTIDGGDKVLVLKPQYDFSSPSRLDVIVFKFPGKVSLDGHRDGGPQENFSAKNYIKRLWGLPGEKLSIWLGDLYLATGGRDGKPVEREIIRKPPGKLLRMRRPVSDYDLQPSDLENTLPPLWADEAAGEGWKPGSTTGTLVLEPSTDERRLSFRNYLRPPPLPAGALRRIGSALRSMANTLGDAERERYQGTDLVLRSLRSIESDLMALDSLTLMPTSAKTQEFRAQLARLEKQLKDTEEGLVVLRKGEGRGENPLGSTFNPRETIRLDIGAALQALTELGEQWKASLESSQQPQLVTDFLGYNALISSSDPSGYYYPRELGSGHEPHWVKDLMLDCEVEITQPGGTLTVELNAGVDRHRARFDLTSGECTLEAVRYSDDPQGKVIATKSAPTAMRGAGRHKLQFANFDDRLTLWIDGQLVFGDGLDYPGPPPEERGPRVGDVKPISILGKNAGLAVRKLQVYRDIYYTRSARNDPPEYEDLRFLDRSALSMANFLGLPANDQNRSPAGRVERWDGFGRQRPWYYPMGTKQEFGREVLDPELPNGPVLGPDEFFALGDNSTRSSDSREWGNVPERLLLGKAVFVYWPLNRFGIIW